MYIPAKILILFYDLFESSDNIFHIVLIWSGSGRLRRINGRVEIFEEQPECDIFPDKNILQDSQGNCYYMADCSLPFRHIPEVALLPRLQAVQDRAGLSPKGLLDLSGNTRAPFCPAFLQILSREYPGADR